MTGPTGSGVTGSSQAELREMVAELREMDCGQGEWNDRFLESLARWQGDFTWRQAMTLQKLWVRAMPAGRIAERFGKPT